MRKRSWENLAGVDPRLSAVVGAAFHRGPHDFIVTEGLRSMERQQELVRAGKSWTLNSKHLEGRAIDIAALDPLGLVTWDIEVYREIWTFQFLPVAARLGVRLEWGGNWKRVDACHFQLAPEA